MDSILICSDSVILTLEEHFTLSYSLGIGLPIHSPRIMEPPPPPPPKLDQRAKSLSSPKITLEKCCFINRGQLDPSSFRTGAGGGGGELICNPKKN